MLIFLNLNLHNFWILDVYFSNPNSFAFSKILESIPCRGNHGIRFFLNTTLALYSTNQEGNIIDVIATETLSIFALIAIAVSISVMVATLNKISVLSDDFRASLQNC